MITNFFIPELNNHDVQELWFQQDGATCHTARATIDLLKDTFGDRLISRFGPMNWPPRSCDLTPLDYFLRGYVKSLVYADKPQTLDHLEDNIRRVIADIRPQMLEKVIENWTSRLDYIRASRGSHMQKSYLKSPIDQKEEEGRISCPLSSSTGTNHKVLSQGIWVAIGAYPHKTDATRAPTKLRCNACPHKTPVQRVPPQNSGATRTHKTTVPRVPPKNYGATRTPKTTVCNAYPQNYGATRTPKTTVQRVPHKTTVQRVPPNYGAMRTLTKFFPHPCGARTTL
ncbi:uncharacterized protein TNCV_3418641 [Trichonephila clavipes]|nr:uncharacterized protein TNCV_3418641 [Trichonephila clavipes]